MGQYFTLINETKKEFVCVYCANGVAKWYEWVFNTQFKLLGLLIRRSNEGGGGDIHSTHEDVIQGSWAGDKISLVGDYDESGLFDKAYSEYKNITEPLLEAWNKEMFEDGSKDYMINFTPCDHCPRSDKHTKMLKRLKVSTEQYRWVLFDVRRALNIDYVTEKDFKEYNKQVKVKEVIKNE